MVVVVIVVVVVVIVDGGGGGSGVARSCVQGRGRRGTCRCSR